MSLLYIHYYMNHYIYRLYSKQGKNRSILLPSPSTPPDFRRPQLNPEM